MNKYQVQFCGNSYQFDHNFSADSDKAAEEFTIGLMKRFRRTDSCIETTLLFNLETKEELGFFSLITKYHIGVLKHNKYSSFELDCD